MRFRLIFCCLAATAVCTGALAAETQRPNILFIFTDDQPQICMGCMGNKHIQTPNMDRLAAKLRGKRCGKMALSIDLAPTMLAMAGAPIPDSMQGRDLTPLLTGQPVEWRADWYYEHVYNTKAPRRPIVKCEGVREEDWKYTRYPEIETTYEQLFDLKRDPHETRNMAGDPAHADTLTRLRARCDEYRRSLQ